MRVSGKAGARPDTARVRSSPSQAPNGLHVKVRLAAPGPGGGTGAIEVDSRCLVATPARLRNS